MKMYKRILFAVCSTFFIFISLYAADRNFGNATVEKVIRVYDGDTFFVNIKGFHPIIGDTIGIRIAGVDTPERRGGDDYTKKLARKARLYTEKRLLKAKVIILKNIRRGKYFRIVADVYVDGENLGKELVRVGLGKKYHGGKKPTW